MNKQIERLRFHIRMTLFFLREKFFPISLAKVLESPELTEFTKEEVDELREMNELLEQEDEEYVRSEPILVPQNTMYFGGGKSKRKVNCLNASRYRTDIQQACTWALSMASTYLLSTTPDLSAYWHWKRCLIFVALVRRFNFMLTKLRISDI